MTDAALVLAWLVLAHLVADFVLQTGSIAKAKAGDGWGAIRGLAAHGLMVALCLVPVGLAFGADGWKVLLATAGSHVIMDRTKFLLTRRAAAAALVDAHRRHEPRPPADHLGRAWTPIPGGLFLLDQLAHLGIAGLVWLVWLSGAPVEPGWRDAVDRLLGGWDRAVVHDVVLTLVVLVSLAIANVRAAALFVGTLVRPVEVTVEGEARWGSVVAPPEAPPANRRRWSIRLGPIDAHLDAEEAPPPRAVGPDAGLPAGHPASSNARVGATIGILERILIVILVLTSSEAAIGFVVAAKTLARFRQLDDRDFAEYYLLGTLASVSVALVTAIVARAVLAGVA